MAICLLGKTYGGIWGGTGRKLHCLKCRSISSPCPNRVRRFSRILPSTFMGGRLRAPIRRQTALQASHPHEIYVRIATTLTWNQLRHVLKMSGNLFSGSKAVLFSRTVNAAKHDRIVQELLLELDPLAGDPTQLLWMPPTIPSGLSPEELTMDELKDYLNMWKLPTSGSKMELVARLKKYQEDSLVQRKADDTLGVESIKDKPLVDTSSGSLEMQSLTSQEMDILARVIHKMKQEDLKGILRAGGAPANGPKAILVARVIRIAESNPKVQQSLLNMAGISIESALMPSTEKLGQPSKNSGRDLADRMPLSMLSVSELREILSSLNLPTSGTKTELMMRLSASQEQKEVARTRSTQIQAMHEELGKIEQMTKESILHYMQDRGVYYPPNLSHLSLLEKSKRWIQSQYYGTGTRIVREDFEALLNRQMRTRNLDHITVMELRLRCKAMNCSAEGSRKELCERLMTWRENEFEISDASSIRLDALAQEWFLQAFMRCREGTLHEKISTFDEEQLHAELRKRGLRVDGGVDELRRLLLSAVSIELGLAHKALAEVATTLIDKVYELEPWKILTLMDLDISPKPSSYIRECCDGLLLHLAPRLLLIYDRETQIEKNARQEVIEMKYSYRHWEIDDSPEMSSEIPLTVAVLCEQDEEGFYIASLQCILDHLQSRRYPQGDKPDNIAPLLSRDKLLKSINVVPYIFDASRAVYRLNAASTFSLPSFQSPGCSVPEGAVHVGTLEEWVKEMGEVDAVLPIMHGPMSVDVSVWKALHCIEAACLGNFHLPSSTLHYYDRSLDLLREKGFPTVTGFVMEKKDVENKEAWYRAFRIWCSENGLRFSQEFFVLKYPYNFGSSHDEEPLPAPDCIQHGWRLLSEGQLDRIVIQRHIPTNQAAEFSCWVLDTENGPVALLPTEIEYPPPDTVRPLSSSKRHHTPPRMDFSKIQSIRRVAEQAFRALDLRDFACIHGCVLMDNTPEARAKKVLPEFPQPIPSGMYKEFLDDEDDPPGLVENLDDIWADHVQEIDDIIGEWESDGKGPSLEEFKQWIDIDQLDPIPDPVPEMKEIRNRRPPTYVKEDLSEAEDVINSMAETPDGDFSELIEGLGYTVALAEVDFGANFPPTSTLFQQAACVGLSHGSILRHVVNRALTRLESPLIEPLPPDTIERNPFYPDLTPIEGEDKVTAENEGESLFDEEDDMKEEEELYKDFGTNEDSINRQMFSTPESDGGTSSAKESGDTTEEQNPKENPQQIWILCGGDGPSQHLSYQSGLNAWQKLRRSGDLQVYLALLVPEEYSVANRERLSELIYRRNRFLEEGVDEEAINTIEELREEFIRSPRISPTSVGWREVVLLDPASMFSFTLDEALENSRRRISATNCAPHTRDSEMVGFINSESLCMNDLLQANIEGIGGLWGGEIASCPLSRYMNMEVFSAEAYKAGAIIHIAVHGGIGTDGTLQDYLDRLDILYTGSGVSASQLSHDRPSLYSQFSVESEDRPLVHAIQSEVVPLTRILTVCDDLEQCNSIFADACEQLKCSSLIIKPATGIQWTSAAKLQRGRDLQIYGQAVKNRKAIIEDSGLSNGHSPVILVLDNCHTYVLEPYIATGPFNWVENSLQVEGTNPWIHVAIGLVGGLGDMRALTPALNPRSVEENYDFNAKVMAGKDNHIIPIPSTICGPNILQKCQKDAQKVGDVLGLSGAALVEGYLNCNDGEFILCNCDASPYLGPNSQLLQQGAHEQVPLYPDDFFREMVIVAATPFSVEDSFDRDVPSYLEDNDAFSLSTSDAEEAVDV